MWNDDDPDGFGPDSEEHNTRGLAFAGFIAGEAAFDRTAGFVGDAEQTVPVVRTPIRRVALGVVGEPLLEPGERQAA
jgi:hypothetical protein